MITLSKCPSCSVTLQSKYGGFNIFFLDMWQIWGIFFHKIFCSGYRPLLLFLVTKWQNFTPKIVNCTKKMCCQIIHLICYSYSLNIYFLNLKKNSCYFIKVFVNNLAKNIIFTKFENLFTIIFIV